MRTDPECWMPPARVRLIASKETQLAYAISGIYIFHSNLLQVPLAIRMKQRVGSGTIQIHLVIITLLFVSPKI